MPNLNNIFKDLIGLLLLLLAVIKTTRMQYNNIDDIKIDFGLDSLDITEIKSELRQLLQFIHPDKNNGSFKSDQDRIKYDKIISALDFMEASKSLTTTNEITALTKIVTDLIKSNKSTDSIQKYEIDLSRKVENSIKLYQSSHLFPKITSSIVTALMTFIWLSPKSFADNPILSKYLSTTSPTFTILWCMSLIFTGLLWYLLSRKERREQKLKSNLNLENTQNKIFHEFINWKVNKLYTPSQTISFSKGELIAFIVNLRVNQNEIRHEPGLSEKYDRLKNMPLSFITNNISIDIELSQSLADLILARVEKKGIVKLEQSKSLTDIYHIEIEGPQ